MYNWIFGQHVSIYLADKMTGWTGYRIWKNYRQRKRVYRRRGIYVTSPLPGEGVRPIKRKLGDRPGISGVKIWEKDKRHIKDSNVFVFPLIGMTSQGCINELVKARGAHWTPTVFIHPKAGFITKEQNDIIVPDDKAAAKYIVKKFGSRWKRAKWRFSMLNQSLPKWMWQQLREFWL